ncbi:NUDIX hydrolase [Actinoallomurus liliacearum]|uniref:NUDIX hydrolase n=1 Tax=Actinoallomurus liliacearum TaxID=1080073 RepID=UPI0031F0E59B
MDPAYKPDWDLPGGMSEANEPPAETVRRELKEELGLEVMVGDLLCVDWVSPHGPWDDSLMFVFSGGRLRSDEITALKITDGELRRFGFSTEAEAAVRLRPYVWRRVINALAALRTGRAVYSQDGHPLTSSQTWLRGNDAR